MRGIDERLHSVTAISVVLVLLVSLLMVTFSSLNALAEEVPGTTEPENYDTELVAPAEGDSLVQNPGLPYVTSEPTDYSIVWVWSAPDGGINPDGVIDPENPDAPMGEQSTDIILFGYEFLKQGAIISRGSVESSQYSITTPVSVNGTYVLRVWSITREGLTSIAAENSVVIAKTIAEPLPEIDKAIIPDPVDVSEVIEKQATSENIVVNTLPLNPTKKLSAPSPVMADSQVLSDSTEQEDSAVPLVSPAIVKPSSEGWVVLGVAWYVWLLIITGMFVAGRGITAYINAR